MSEENKAVLRQANAAVRAGDNEGFLAFCAHDIVWSTVGGETLHGIEAVRQQISKDYVAPPDFTVEQMIADGDYVVALGKLATKDVHGAAVQNDYCDVWRVDNGKLAELRAFVVPEKKS